MNLREKRIALAAAGLLGLLALDQLALTPLWRWREQLIVRRANLTQRWVDAQATLAASRRAERAWNEFRAAGLTHDASRAESSLLAAMQNWSQQTDLPLLSIRPDRTSGSNGLRDLTFQASADGMLRALTQFLYRVETTRLPVRVRELQLAVRTEATDDLTMQIRLSTLWEEKTKVPDMPTTPGGSAQP